MKTKEELNALKNEVEALNKKLGELSEEEIKQVSGGSRTANQSEMWYCKYCSMTTLQTWMGVGHGWDTDGNKHWCDLWKCELCDCINYRDVETGRLL